MCAISGIINVGKYGSNLNNEIMCDLDKANEVQRHRGPDASGVCAFSFSDQKSICALTAKEVMAANKTWDGILGFNRLSIKDLSSAGNQPMVGAEGKVILVFNGEIYNDKELRDELIAEKHCVFKGSSDTEVILNLYLEYGFEYMINKLNGMFAIVIVDLRRAMIFMARDRFGIKPLYYSFYKNHIVFASELKGIIQFSDFERELDLDAYNARLMFSRPGDKVLLNGVELLKPGQVIYIDSEGNINQKKYFDLDNYVRDEGKYKDINEAIEAAENVFADAISRQMVSDVKVGCQLSGGIDSSIVSYYANQLRTENLNDAVSIIDRESGGGGREIY